MVCTNTYVLYCAVEKCDKGKPLTHREFLEVLCERQCRPPSKHKGTVTESKKRAIKLTISHMQKQPWLHCESKHLSDATKGAKCAWCRFKHKLQNGAYENSDAAWSKYCASAAIPETSDHRASLRCVNCTFSFCGVSCYREFHQMDPLE